MLFIGFLLGIIILSASCSKRIYQITYPTLNDGKYDTEFPYRNCSKELKQIGETIKLINSIAYYKSYVFDEASQVRRHLLTTEFIKNNASHLIYFNNSSSGTATIILHKHQRVALLTCAHIVNFPDTLVKYFTMEDSRPGFYIQSVAIKEKQTNYVTDLCEITEFDILKMDEANDIAILGAELPATEDFILPVFDYPIGNAKKLEWGSFVYLMGFPRGYKLITRGIVSDPNRTKNGMFIVDALFNRGCSGGLVLAVKDGVPNFEFVGIAKSAAAEYEYLIRPADNFDQSKYDTHFPYTGEIFVDYKANIQYGVTHVVPVEEIQAFFKRNKDYFIENGYDFSSFTGK
jgi:hypothetical protein